MTNCLRQTRGGSLRMVRRHLVHGGRHDVITVPYLLVLNISLYYYDGSYWADPLWKKDLAAHRTEISNLSIACPVVRRPAPATWQRLAVSGITVHPLPSMGRLSPLLVPILLVRLWHAISHAEIVHVAVAGWPFPLGWLAIPIARLRHRWLVLVVESAFWRVTPGAYVSHFTKLRAALWERLNKRAAAACDIGFYTTLAYKQDLPTRVSAASYVLPAVWIDEEQLINRDRLSILSTVRNGRFLYAGRLTAGKGVAILLAAIEQSGIAVDIIGEGELASSVLAAASRYPHLVRLLSTVNYGAPFMRLLDSYAALVVPTITDEQPRVIFDAFARGVTVIASATTGNQQIVDHDRNGLLFPAGDAEELATALIRANARPDRIAAMGETARTDMQGRTHRTMHAERARLISNIMGNRMLPPTA